MKSNVSYRLMLTSQTQMNVLLALLTLVVQMLSVQTLLGHTLARVKVDSMVMAIRVLT